MGENVLEIKLSGTGGAANAASPTSVSGTRPGGSAQAPPPVQGSGGAVDDKVGADGFFRQLATDMKNARELARQTQREAEAARRQAVASGTVDDKKAYARAAEAHRQARYDLGTKSDGYGEASQAAEAMQRKRDEDNYMKAEADRARAEQRRQGEAEAKAAEKKAADIRAEYSRTVSQKRSQGEAEAKAKEARDADIRNAYSQQLAQKAAEKERDEKAAEVAVAKKKKAEAKAGEKAVTDAASARNERRLMHMTLGDAAQQAAGGSMTDLLGAGVKAAGSGAFGEIAASMAGGPEAAAVMAAVQAGKAMVNMAVERAQSVAPYSGAVQGANAVAQARTTMADINEAGRMGGTYATLIDSQSRLENSARSAFDPIRDAIIQHITDFLESYADIAEDIQPILDILGEFIGGGIKVWSFINTLPIKLVAGLIHAMAEWFDDENGKKKKTSGNLFEGIDEAIKAMHVKERQGDIRQPTDATAAAGIPMGFPAWSKS